MGMFFAPMANVILSSVSPAEEGKASGANNAVREVGGVFGVAVLASVFSRYGGYASPETFNDGLVVATWVGAAVVAAGALAALAIPGKARRSSRRRARAGGSRVSHVAAAERRPRCQAIADRSGRIRESAPLPGGQEGTGHDGSGSQSSQPVGNASAAITRSASARIARASASGR